MQMIHSQKEEKFYEKEAGSHLKTEDFETPQYRANSSWEEPF